MRSPSLRRFQVRGTVLFILGTAFLNLAGVGIIAPVLPFITGRYTDPQNTAFVGSLLFTAYSLFQFLATPTLGALSDRFGRRPVMLISLFGSAIGYFLLGIGGSIWMLFAGRIIDGITGGNLATIYAYATDITEPQNRTRFFGMLGAAGALGFVFGPALGFVTYSVTQSEASPLYAAGVLTLLNVIWGYFAMPESLPPERRETSLSLASLNPVRQLVAVFSLPQVRLLLVATFLWAMSFAALQSNMSFFAEAEFQWDATRTNLIFLLVGIVVVITQGLIVPRVLPILGEERMTLLGLGSIVTSFLLIALSPTVGGEYLMLLGNMPAAFGNGLIVPSLTAILSRSVGVREQGRIQGGNQAVQALARSIGPIWAGAAFTSITHSSPYLIGAVGLLLAALIFQMARQEPKPKRMPIG
jgi:DHA1 family tetracycline resistance protein-like MFS transporter